MDSKKDNERELWAAAVDGARDDEAAGAAVVSKGARQLLGLCQASGARPDWFCHVCARTIRYGATIGGRFVCEECTDKARQLEAAGQ